MWRHDGPPQPPGADGAFCPHCQPREATRLRSAGRALLDTDQACPVCHGGLVLAEGGRVAEYDERAIATTTFDLEKVIRAEAVDGWELVDTTFHAREPHRLHAHFRRAVRTSDRRGPVADAPPPPPGSRPEAKAAPSIEPKVAAPPSEDLDPVPEPMLPPARSTRQRRSQRESSPNRNLALKAFIAWMALSWIGDNAGPFFILVLLATIFWAVFRSGPSYG